jgi:hypothetical protein
LQERAARPYVWLDVTYNGKHPPIELFADLEMIGWSPPAPAPPPRSAIDWDRHDDETGEPFTIRDYTVEDVVGAPTGTGERGRWTPGERAAYLRALDGVLRRHHLSRSPLDALPPPPTPVGRDAGAAATAPPATGDDRLRSSPAADDTLVLIEAVLAPGVRSQVVQAVTSLGLSFRIDARARETTVRFRGSVSTTTETRYVLVAVAPASSVPNLEAILVNRELLSDPEALVVDDLRADQLQTFLAPRDSVGEDLRTVMPPDDRAPAAGPDEDAKVTLVLSPQVFAHLGSMLRDASARVIERSDVRRLVSLRHRGSVRTQAVPGVRAVVVLRSDEVPRLLAELGDAGVDADDPEQVHVEWPAPEPARPPSPAAADADRRGATLHARSSGSGAGREVRSRTGGPAERRSDAPAELS